MPVFRPGKQLVKAAENGQWDEVASILQKHPGVNVNTTDKSNWTALHHAAYGQHKPTVRLLVKHGANVNARARFGETPLHMAAHMNRVPIIEFLTKECQAELEARDSDGQTPLHKASIQGNKDAVEALVKSGAELEAKDNSGQTPLHTASWEGQKDAVKALLKLGAKLEAKGDNGWTPLHWASRWGRKDAVEALLKSGANPKARDKNGKTPLDIAGSGWRVDDEDKAAVVQLLKSPPAPRPRVTKRPAESPAVTRKTSSNNGGTNNLPNGNQVPSPTLGVSNSSQALSPNSHQTQKSINQENTVVALSNSATHQGSEASSTIGSAVAGESMVSDIFLSHTGQDSKAAIFAGFLADKLQEKHGLTAFLDSQNLRTGDTWKQVIETNAKNCRIFVCIISPQYFQRYWCMHELDLALGNRRQIVPVYLDGQVPKGSTSTHKQFVQLHASKTQNEEDIAAHHPSNEVADRWCQNLVELDSIQGIRNYSTHKHALSAFCAQVAQTISDTLGK